MKKTFLAVILTMAATTLTAQNNGGISQEMLSRLQQSFENTPADKALRNAINNNSIDALALNSENANTVDNNFTYKVESKGITDQKSSGRCWLFTGLNVLRSQMMAKNNLPELTLSQNYNFFYDQLEKSNLFLQGVIDTREKPMDDKVVDWLFKNALADGGQYTGFSEIITKYGVVPTEAMHETTSSESTARIRQLMTWKLREDGLKLREMAEKGASLEALETEKETMLKEVYRMLVLAYGVPPTQFSWTRKDKKGNIVSTKTYTPQEFYREFAGNDLQNGYVMLMNDPLRPYYKLYEIEYDRHNYDGPNWTYINLPVDDIKKIAIESLKDSTMMYFSCDVNKYLDRKRGVLDPNNYDYESLFGVKFGMDKHQRVLTHSSGSSHAMSLMAVDIDENGKPVKWMVENSWGPGANNGHLIMTDRWFDDYMFRLVADKKYVPKKILKILEQKPEKLPAWDPMFSPEE